MFLQSSFSASEFVRSALCADIVTDPIRCGVDLFYEIPSLAVKLGLSLAVFALVLLVWAGIIFVAVFAARVLLCKSFVFCRSVYGLSLNGFAKLRQKLGKTRVECPGSAQKSSQASLSKITNVTDSFGQYLSVPKGVDKVKTFFKSRTLFPQQCIAHEESHSSGADQSKSEKNEPISPIMKTLKKVQSSKVSFGRSPRTP